MKYLTSCRKTVETALDILGAAGLVSPNDVQRHHVMLRTSGVQSCSYADHFPPEQAGALVAGTGTARLQVSTCMMHTVPIESI